MNPEFGIKPANSKDRVDDPEAIEDLERAGLDAFSTRALEGSFCSFDETTGDSPAQEIEGKGQPGRAGSDNQNGFFVHGTKNLNSTLYECKTKDHN